MWPVKPMKRTLPCSLALSSASARRRARRSSPDRRPRRPRGSARDRGDRSGAAQTLLELHHRVLGLAVVGAVLGHQEGFVAIAVLRQRLAHAPFGIAVVVLPGVVEEGGAGVDRAVNDGDGFRLIRRADMRAADAEKTDLFAGFAKWSSGICPSVISFPFARRVRFVGGIVPIWRGRGSHRHRVTMSMGCSGRVDARRDGAGRLAGPLEGRGLIASWLAIRSEWLELIILLTCMCEEGPNG